MRRSLSLILGSILFAGSAASAGAIELRAAGDGSPARVSVGGFAGGHALAEGTNLGSEAQALASGTRTLGDLLDRGREIRFEPGTIKLLEASLPFLDELAAALVKEPAARLDIVVHTADTGDAKKDMTLSKRRADAIKRVLVDKGANADQLLATGRGSEDPVAPNLTRTGRFRNERVELHRASPPIRGS